MFVADLLLPHSREHPGRVNTKYRARASALLIFPVPAVDRFILINKAEHPEQNHSVSERPSLPIPLKPFPSPS